MNLKYRGETFINISHELHKFLTQNNNERWEMFSPPPSREEIKRWEMKIKKSLLEDIMVGYHDIFRFWDFCPQSLLNREIVPGN